MDNIETVTLFVRDLDAANSFYALVFDKTPVYEDDVSWVIQLDGLMINLLKSTEAAEVIEPLTAGEPNAGPRMMFTIRVDSADSACADLRKKGITLLNGPVDRPWGRRTASFADPDGNVWELANEF